MKKRTFSWFNDEHVRELIFSLKNNKISICTTDTILGFLAPLSNETFELLNTIKGRQEKPYVVLIGSQKDAEYFADIHNPKIKKLINAWPGPLTLVLKANQGLPDFVQSKQGTIALRFPDHRGLQTVIKEVGPLFSTSANKAGESVPETIDEVNPTILKNVDLIIADDRKSVTPSTILDCTNPDYIKVIRKGAYLLEDLDF